MCDVRTPNEVQGAVGGEVRLKQIVVVVGEDLFERLPAEVEAFDAVGAETQRSAVLVSKDGRRLIDETRRVVFDPARALIECVARCYLFRKPAFGTGDDQMPGSIA